MDAEYRYHRRQAEYRAFASQNADDSLEMLFRKLTADPGLAQSQASNA